MLAAALGPHDGADRADVVASALVQRVPCDVLAQMGAAMELRRLQGSEQLYADGDAADAAFFALAHSVAGGGGRLVFTNPEEASSVSRSGDGGGTVNGTPQIITLCEGDVVGAEGIAHVLAGTVKGRVGQFAEEPARLVRARRTGSCACAKDGPVDVLQLRHCVVHAILAEAAAEMVKAAMAKAAVVAAAAAIAAGAAAASAADAVFAATTQRSELASRVAHDLRNLSLHFLSGLDESGYYALGQVAKVRQVRGRAQVRNRRSHAAGSLPAALHANDHPLRFGNTDAESSTEGDSEQSGGSCYFVVSGCVRVTRTRTRSTVSESGVQADFEGEDGANDHKLLQGQQEQRQDLHEIVTLSSGACFGEASLAAAALSLWSEQEPVMRDAADAARSSLAQLIHVEVIDEGDTAKGYEGVGGDKQVGMEDASSTATSVLLELPARAAIAAICLSPGADASTPTVAHGATDSHRDALGGSGAGIAWDRRLLSDIILKLLGSTVQLQHMLAHPFGPTYFSKYLRDVARRQRRQQHETKQHDGVQSATEAHIKWEAEATVESSVQPGDDKLNSGTLKDADIMRKQAVGVVDGESSSLPALSAQSALHHLRIVINVEKFKRGHFHGLAHVTDSAKGTDRSKNEGIQQAQEPYQGSTQGEAHSHTAGTTSSAQARYRRALSRERSTSAARAITAASSTTMAKTTVPVDDETNIDISLEHAASRRHRALSELFSTVQALCVHVHGANPLLRERFDQLKRLEHEYAQRPKAHVSREDLDTGLAWNVQAQFEHEMVLYEKQIAIVSIAQAESIRWLGTSTAGVSNGASSFEQFKSSRLFDKLLHRRLRAPGPWVRAPSHGDVSAVSFASVLIGAENERREARRDRFGADSSVHLNQRGREAAHERESGGAEERNISGRDLCEDASSVQRRRQRLLAESSRAARVTAAQDAARRRHSVASGQASPSSIVFLDVELIPLSASASEHGQTHGHGHGISLFGNRHGSRHGTRRVLAFDIDARELRMWNAASVTMTASQTWVAAHAPMLKRRHHGSARGDAAGSSRASSDADTEQRQYVETVPLRLLEQMMRSRADPRELIVVRPSGHTKRERTLVLRFCPEGTALEGFGAREHFCLLAHSIEPSLIVADEGEWVFRPAISVRSDVQLASLTTNDTRAGADAAVSVAHIDNDIGEQVQSSEQRPEVRGVSIAPGSSISQATKQPLVRGSLPGPRRGALPDESIAAAAAAAAEASAAAAAAGAGGQKRRGIGIAKAKMLGEALSKGVKGRKGAGRTLLRGVTHSGHARNGIKRDSVLERAGSEPLARSSSVDKRAFDDGSANHNYGAGGAVDDAGALAYDLSVVSAGAVQRKRTVVLDLQRSRLVVCEPLRPSVLLAEQLLPAFGSHGSMTEWCVDSTLRVTKSWTNPCRLQLVLPQNSVETGSEQRHRQRNAAGLWSHGLDGPGGDGALDLIFASPAARERFGGYVRAMRTRAILASEMIAKPRVEPEADIALTQSGGTATCTARHRIDANDDKVDDDELTGCAGKEARRGDGGSALRVFVGTWAVDGASPPPGLSQWWSNAASSTSIDGAANSGGDNNDMVSGLSAALSEPEFDILAVSLQHCAVEHIPEWIHALQRSVGAPQLGSTGAAAVLVRGTDARNAQKDAEGADMLPGVGVQHSDPDDTDNSDDCDSEISRNGVVVSSGAEGDDNASAAVATSGARSRSASATRVTSLSSSKAAAMAPFRSRKLTATVRNRGNSRSGPGGSRRSSKDERESHDARHDSHDSASHNLQEEAELTRTRRTSTMSLTALAREAAAAAQAAEAAICAAGRHAGLDLSVSALELAMGQTLEQVLMTPSSAELFARHMHEEMSDENLRFWGAANAFLAASDRVLETLAAEISTLPTLTPVVKAQAGNACRETLPTDVRPPDLQQQTPMTPVAAAALRQHLNAADDLYDTFVAPSSLEPVNLPSAIVRRFEAALDALHACVPRSPADQPHERQSKTVVTEVKTAVTTSEEVVQSLQALRTVSAAAQHEIFMLMDMDSLPRFFQSLREQQTRMVAQQQPSERALRSAAAKLRAGMLSIAEFEQVAHVDYRWQHADAAHGAASEHEASNNAMSPGATKSKHNSKGKGKPKDKSSGGASGDRVNSIAAAPGLSLNDLHEQKAAPFSTLAVVVDGGLLMVIFVRKHLLPLVSHVQTSSVKAGHDVSGDSRQPHNVGRGTNDCIAVGCSFEMDATRIAIAGLRLTPGARESGRLTRRRELNTLMQHSGSIGHKRDEDGCMASTPWVECSTIRSSGDVWEWSGDCASHADIEVVAEAKVADGRQQRTRADQTSSVGKHQRCQLPPLVAVVDDPAWLARQMLLVGVYFNTDIDADGNADVHEASGAETPHENVNIYAGHAEISLAPIFSAVCAAGAGAITQVGPSARAGPAAELGVEAQAKGGLKLEAESEATVARDADAEAEVGAESHTCDRSEGAVIQSQPVSLCVPLVRGERTVGSVRFRVSARAVDRQRQHEAVLQAATALVQWRRHAEGLAELARTKTQVQAGNSQSGNESGASASAVATPMHATTAQRRREQWQAALECVAATGAAAVLRQVHEGMRDEQEREREQESGK
eukprot:g792.t1